MCVGQESQGRRKGRDESQLEKHRRSGRTQEVVFIARRTAGDLVTLRPNSGKGTVAKGFSHGIINWNPSQGVQAED